MSETFDPQKSARVEKSAAAISAMPILEKCHSPRWAAGGHLQTLLGHFLPSPKLSELGQQFEIAVGGDDKIVAHCFAGKSQSVVYLFHGLGGFSHAAYMQRTAILARARGHTVYMLNHRGCGEGLGLAREPYHSGRAEDLSALIAFGRDQHPNKKHLAIGFSLSGNALLLLAAGQRASVLPDAAIAVNAPIDLSKTAVMLKTGMNRIYDIDFMRQMRQTLKERAKLDHKVAKIKVPKFATLMDFDGLYTAPHGGFKDREDYYESCSAGKYLKNIVIPTVALTAANDPFVSVEDYKNMPRSRLVHVHIEPIGGHMGYLSAKATPLGSRRWLDYALASYMDALLAGM